jgi:type IV pilus assembly protein PilX
MANASRHQFRTLGRRQDGAVLVVALIFLLLVTLIGVSSMQNATLQEKMAGSVALKNRSFQVAEASLRLGENAVQAIAYNLAPCANAAACAPPPDAISMALAAGQGVNGVLWISNNTLGNDSSTGFYGVQFLGTNGDVVNVPASCSDPNSIKLYRITGVGTTGVSRTVVESMYVKC